MASAKHLKALLNSYIEGDDDHFFSVAMQVAAHEAKLGHGKLAEEIRAMIDTAKMRRSTKPIPINQPRGELADILGVSYPTAHLGDMILGNDLLNQILRVIREQRFARKIFENGLSPRRKLLLVGPPGTGKTMTASVLAGELGLPLLQIRLDGLITKYMGETAAKLRQVFNSTDHTRGIYFFDEFDAIGSQRGLTNDVGEIRRVLNSFLQMIEQDTSHSLIIAATNHAEILDPALYRRFDDIFRYELPNKSQIEKLLETRLVQKTSKRISWQGLAKIAQGLSHAEITRATEEVLKHSLIYQRKAICEQEIQSLLNERKNIIKEPCERT